MKKAIWNVAPFGDFAFRGARDSQLTLGVESPDLSGLERALCEELGGDSWVRIERIIEFVQSDRVEYHSGHLKKQVLKPLERQGRLRAREGTRKRRGTYPAGTQLMFDC